MFWVLRPFLLSLIGFFLFLKLFGVKTDEEPCHMAFPMSFGVVCLQWSFSVMVRPLVLLIEIPWDIHHDPVVTLIPQTPSSLMPSPASSRNGGCRLALKHKTDTEIELDFYAHNLTVTNLLILLFASCISTWHFWYLNTLLLHTFTPYSMLYKYIHKPVQGIAHTVRQGRFGSSKWMSCNIFY